MYFNIRYYTDDNMLYAAGSSSTQVLTHKPLQSPFDAFQIPLLNHMYMQNDKTWYSSHLFSVYPKFRTLNSKIQNAAFNPLTELKSVF